MVEWAVDSWMGSWKYKLDSKMTATITQDHPLIVLQISYSIFLSLLLTKASMDFLIVFYLWKCITYEILRRWLLIRR